MNQTFRCTIQYDGTSFAGFQRQPGQLTVQGTLESALAQVTRQTVSVVGAGRTDTGVHALGQVIHFCCDTALPQATLQRALNACLPSQIAITDLAEAPEGFHARYAATSREYRYVVDTAPVASPLLARRVHHVGQPLAVETMAEATESLVGTHDFAAFGTPMEHTKRGEDGSEVTWRGGTIRTMLAARCWRARRFVFFAFVANAFLRHMARMLVGTLLRVGRGSLLIPAFQAMLQGDRSVPAGPAAPAHGLYLVRVRYEF